MKTRVAALAISAFALISLPVNAADMAHKMPVKAPPPAPAPIFSWTGFYVGVNGGWGWNGTTGDTYCITPDGVIQGDGCSILPNGNLKPSGGLGGGQIGYNLQYGQLVYGIEADIQAADISGAATILSSGFPSVGGGTTGPGSFTESQKLDWFGTVRGRLGWTPWERTLLYATGGLIYGHEQVSGLLLFNSGNSYPASDSSVRTGWTAGGGVEYAFWSNVSARIEGLYYDMGNETISSGVNPNTGFTRNYTFNFRGGILRAALNYKFN